MIRAVLEVPESEKSQEKSYNTENKWLGRVRVLVEIGTLCAVVTYACITLGRVLETSGAGPIGCGELARQMAVYEKERKRVGAL